MSTNHTLQNFVNTIIKIKPTSLKLTFTKTTIELETISNQNPTSTLIKITSTINQENIITGSIVVDYATIKKALIASKYDVILSINDNNTLTITNSLGEFIYSGDEEFYLRKRSYINQENYDNLDINIKQDIQATINLNDDLTTLQDLLKKSTLLLSTTKSDFEYYNILINVDKDSISLNATNRFAISFSEMRLKNNSKKNTQFFMLAEIANIIASQKDLKNLKIEISTATIFISFNDIKLSYNNSIESYLHTGRVKSLDTVFPKEDRKVTRFDINPGQILNELKIQAPLKTKKTISLDIKKSTMLVDNIPATIKNDIELKYHIDSKLLISTLEILKDSKDCAVIIYNCENYISPITLLADRYHTILLGGCKE